MRGLSGVDSLRETSWIGGRKVNALESVKGRFHVLL